MGDEKKIETTVGGLKRAFAKWSEDENANPENFMSDDQVKALTHEEYGVSATGYFMGLLEGQQAPSKSNPR